MALLPEPRIIQDARRAVTDPSGASTAKLVGATVVEPTIKAVSQGAIDQEIDASRQALNTVFDERQALSRELEDVGAEALKLGPDVDPQLTARRKDLSSKIRKIDLGQRQGQFTFAAAEQRINAAVREQSRLFPHLAPEFRRMGSEVTGKVGLTRLQPQLSQQQVQAQKIQAADATAANAAGFDINDPVDAKTWSLIKLNQSRAEMSKATTVINKNQIFQNSELAKESFRENVMTAYAPILLGQLKSLRDPETGLYGPETQRQITALLTQASTRAKADIGSDVTGEDRARLISEIDNITNSFNTMAKDLGTEGFVTSMNNITKAEQTQMLYENAPILSSLIASGMTDPAAFFVSLDQLRIKEGGAMAPIVNKLKTELNNILGQKPADTDTLGDGINRTINKDNQVGVLNLLQNSILSVLDSTNQAKLVEQVAAGTVDPSILEVAYAMPESTKLMLRGKPSIEGQVTQTASNFMARLTQISGSTPIKIQYSPARAALAVTSQDGSVLYGIGAVSEPFQRGDRRNLELNEFRAQFGEGASITKLSPNFIEQARIQRLIKALDLTSDPSKLIELIESNANQRLTTKEQP